VVYGAATRPGTYTNNVTAVQYSANNSRSEIAKITNHCLGCHSDQNNTAQPFGDGKTPKQYAWDSTSVAARYSQSGRTTWGKYSTVANAAQKRIAKAYSAHGNAEANKRGWDTTNGVDGVITDTSSSTNVQCFDCHNSHGSTVDGVTTRYASATANGGILKDTTVERSGAAVAYKPYSGGSAANKNKRNPGASLCLDCHMNQNATTTPWGYNSTYGATQQVLGYWDSPYMSYSGAGAKQRYPYKSPRMLKGGHLGSSTPLTTSAMSSIGGLCTPCHDPHGVSPTLGANQQYAVPLLKGTFLTSPYKEDVAPVNNWAKTTFNESTFHIDQNTFGSRIGDTVSGINETDSQFAGLCMQCHSKGSLTNGTTHTWKSKDRIHESVKGWKSANGNIKHNYSCSKCHSTHTSSVLPRLMVTNCMDTKHKGRMALNMSPSLSGSSSGDVGAGSGRIPGYYSSYGDASPGTYQPTCHENNTGSGTDQGWNNVTPWVWEPPITITSGPRSELRATSYLTGVWWTFLWDTNIAGSTTVDCGLTDAYGITNTDPGLVLSHVGVVNNLQNHTTYHYRVRSVSYTGNSVVSADQTVYISAPPSVPTPIAHANVLCAGSCSETLQWNASQDVPDNGPIQYFVEVDTSSSFGSANKQSSGWISGTSWSPTLATNNTWYWRVQARDGNHTTPQDPPSGWLTTNSFIMSNRITAGPTASGFKSNPDAEAVISWSTDFASISAVDYGTTTSYGQTATDASLVTSHSVTLHNLANHTTIHYRVRFTDSYGNEVVSGDKTFFISVPPTVPTLIQRLNDYTCVTSCPETVSWNPSTDPDGGTIQYQVQVDSSSIFDNSGGLLQTSTWLDASTTSWTPILATNNIWFVRVQAKDATNNVISAWSPVAFFTVSSANPPPAPTIIANGGCGTDVCGNPCVVTLALDTVTVPDGHAPQFMVELTTDPTFAAITHNSGWLAANQLAWSPPALGAATWYWRVWARDSVEIGAVSQLPSSTGTFNVANNYNECVCDPKYCYGSCPFVFAWDGKEYRYVADLAGPVIGLPPNTAISRAVKLFEPSYLVMDGLKPGDDGQYRIKLRETLREITYVDEGKLLVVDYPKGYQIVSSTAENPYTWGYREPFRIFTIKDPRPPISAIDMHGRDILDTVLKVDNRSAPVTKEAPDDYYTFDFGAIKNPAHAKLVIDGWSLYKLENTLKEHKGDIQPFIEVVDASGRWVKARSFGPPAGDLKTMVIDIADIFPTNDHRIRLHLGIRDRKWIDRWVIDRIMLDDSEPVKVKMRELAAVSAELGFGGALKLNSPTLDNRISAIDNRLSVFKKSLGYGRFTRYGDVKELLAGRDDKYVIMRHGDELTMIFPAVDEISEKGMERGFIFKADHYYKAFDASKTVEPLPFHGMSAYPYPANEHYPADKEHTDYLERYNTRVYVEERSDSSISGACRGGAASDNPVVALMAGPAALPSISAEKELTNPADKISTEEQATKSTEKMTVEEGPIIFKEVDQNVSLWDMVSGVVSKLWSLLAVILNWVIAIFAR
jgi:hypothetical protein